MIVNRTQLANLLGCSATKVLSLVKRGAPYISRPKSQGGAWQFETADVIKWMADEKSTDQTMSADRQARLLKDAKLRLRAAQADLRELELGEKQGVVIHIDDVVERVEVKFAIVKSLIMAMPGRVAQAVSVESDAAKVHELLKAEVDLALEQISKPWNE